jgi:ligand-binding sensor domain-containing protein
LYYFNLNKNLIVKKTHIKGTIISDLAIMRKNGQSSLWYISDQGLTGLSLDNNKILVHLDLKNFNDARLTAIIIDENKKIWISSYNGIYAYDYPIDNVITVNNRNGLVNQEFNFKAQAKLHNGQLIFGGLNGYDIVNSVLFNFTGKQLKGSIFRV